MATLFLLRLNPMKKGLRAGLPILVETTHVVAGRRVLDLDNRGPKVGELLGGERTRDDAGEIENFHAGQRRRCMGH